MTTEILDVVGEIYEAAYQPDHWEKALHGISQLVNSNSAALFVKSHKKKRTFSMYGYGIPKAGLYAYNHGFANIDPAFKIMAKEPAGKARNIYNPDEPDFKHGIYHRLMNKPVNIHYVAGMNVFNDDDWIVGLGLHRSQGMGAFEPARLDALSGLLPHIQRAMRIQQVFKQLRLREKAFSTGLSHLSLGVVVVNRQGHVVFSNPVADSIIQSHPAIQLNELGLCATSNEQNKKLSKCIAEVQSQSDSSRKPTSRTLYLQHYEAHNPLTILVTHCDSQDYDLPTASDEPLALVYLSDPNAGSSISTESLKSRFSLTEAESLVTIGIVNGLTIEQIAEINNVSTNTVKSQLKTIFRKTDCNRQVDLVRTLLNQPLGIKV
ncbi:MAG: helix-turn-helix transcriptional regulator [Gammaproteobacteria bacterium]|nr:helix-turn-helix transcriptional regulator [Gammaproteobacteria bacterium]